MSAGDNYRKMLHCWLLNIFIFNLISLKVIMEHSKFKVGQVYYTNLG